MKIKGKRYTYNTLEEMIVACQRFLVAGDTTFTNSNPTTGEYWIEVMLKGEQVKKELPR